MTFFPMDKANGYPMARSVDLSFKLFFFGGTYQSGSCSLTSGDYHLDFIVVPRSYKRLMLNSTVAQFTLHLEFMLL